MNKKENSEIGGDLVKNSVELSECFRQNLLYYVGKNNMTMVELANKSDIPINTINSFLHRISNDMKISNVAKIAKTLNVSIDELVGADTMHDLTKESLDMCRNMPENDLRLVRWFIRCLTDLNSKTEPNKRYITVMLPEKDNHGNYKLVSRFEKVEITGLEEPIRSKVYIGFKMFSEYYMPYYFPGDILLIANDRPAKSIEHVVVRAGDYVFVVKRLVEDGVAKYYSIRDGKYRIDESEVDELIGYVAHVLKA